MSPFGSGGRRQRKAVAATAALAHSPLSFAEASLFIRFSTFASSLTMTAARCAESPPRRRGPRTSAAGRRPRPQPRFRSGPRGPVPRRLSQSRTGRRGGCGAGRRKEKEVEVRWMKWTDFLDRLFPKAQNNVSLVCLLGPNRTSADYYRLTHCRMGPSMKASTWLEQDSEEEEAIVVVVGAAEEELISGNQQGSNWMDDPRVFSSVLPLFL